MNRTFQVIVCAVALLVATVLTPVKAGQLSPRPTNEWITSLEAPARIATLKMDEIFAKLQVKPGQVVADLGAGPGVFSLRFAKDVAPGGKVYAVEIQQEYIDHINLRAKEQGAANMVAVLGKFTDPNLPARDVDLGFFHDVLHHIDDRAGYIKALASYIKPTGRIAIVEFEPGQGGHKDDAKLQVSKQQAKDWMAAAGFVPTEEFDVFQDRWFVVYARR